MKKRYVLLLILLLCGVSAIASRQFFPKTVKEPEPVYLPAAAVPAKIIQDPETLAELAAVILERDKLKVANGQIRDEAGRLHKLIQVLSVATGPVEPPEPEIVKEIVHEACDTEDGALVGRVEVNAVEFETADSYGWSGKVLCEIAAPYAQRWTPLVDRPFTLANTRAAVSAPPAVPERVVGRFGWYAGGSYPITNVSSNQDYQDVELRKAGVEGGSSIRIGKRFHWQNGVSYDGQWAFETSLAVYPWRNP